jgi:hypothetical protein
VDEVVPPRVLPGLDAQDVGGEGAELAGQVVLRQALEGSGDVARVKISTSVPRSASRRAVSAT